MEDIQIVFNGKGKNRKATLLFNNECTIFNIEKLHSQLIEYLKKNTVHNVLIDNMRNIDAAGVQLFIALKKEFENKSMDVTFEYNLHEDIRNILENCGFKELIHN